MRKGLQGGVGQQHQVVMTCETISHYHQLEIQQWIAKADFGSPKAPVFACKTWSWIVEKITRMHQKLPFGDLKSKHFLGRGTAPPQTFPPVTLPQTLLLLRPFPHTAPRLRRLDSRACCARPRPSGLDVPHPHNIFTPHSSFSRSMPVKFSSVFSESQFLYFVYCFFDQNATTGAKVKVDQ